MPEVFVGVGSNVDRELNIRSGLAALGREFGDIESSSVYCSEAVGFAGDAFLNLVIRFTTELTVAELGQRLRAIETAHGREANMPKFSSRTLDLDILLYGDASGEVDGVTLPREEVVYNAFVLRPLAELAPESKHPRLGKTFARLWAELSVRTEQRLEKINF
ncbi:MAG TPA: 2-amino-4-hydroxy-6-hydroxymethyldihydropteridine diphosphokinase [Spongiibacteraceae bacterium]|nr:2-amino-4-hydroxy-6-hydroxymethyldihydropteridine diphosphokinase [Spongiibacteraceae bacterium]HCS27849.1 2-amino-4-hydroxy-6-hydroxymethyldihydropteridine diphosphokinase [Spongiibacteraceae bacterium]